MTAWAISTWAITTWAIATWPLLRVVTYVVMAYIGMPRHSCGLYSRGLYSYGQYRYGLCSLYSYGQHSHAANLLVVQVPEHPRELQAHAVDLLHDALLLFRFGRLCLWYPGIADGMSIARVSEAVILSTGTPIPAQ